MIDLRRHPLGDVAVFIGTKPFHLRGELSTSPSLTMIRNLVYGNFLISSAFDEHRKGRSWV